MVYRTAALVLSDPVQVNQITKPLPLYVGGQYDCPSRERCLRSGICEVLGKSFRFVKYQNGILPCKKSKDGNEVR